MARKLSIHSQDSDHSSDLVSEQSSIHSDTRHSTRDTSPSNTLFVSGFPIDFKYRELFNLFRFRKGFVKAVLNNQLGPKPIAWVRFDSIENALESLETFSGLRIDPYLRNTLTVEFSPVTGILRNRISRPQVVTFPGIPGAFVPAPYGLSQSRPSPRETKNVLYIGNVGDMRSEDVHELLSGLSGFQELDWKVTDSQVEFGYAIFQDDASAHSALNTLSSIRTDLSGSDGLRVQYARKYTQAN